MFSVSLRSGRFNSLERYFNKFGYDALKKLIEKIKEKEIESGNCRWISFHYESTSEINSKIDASINDALSLLQL